SNEAQATTRTVVPNYSVIDLTEAVSAALLSQPPAQDLLTGNTPHNFDKRRTSPLGSRHVDNALGTNATALKLAVARFKERWPQIQLDYDPVLVTPKS